TSAKGEPIQRPPLATLPLSSAVASHRSIGTLPGGALVPLRCGRGLAQQAVAAQDKAGAAQPFLPAQASADGGGVLEQAVLFLLAGQARELAGERVLGVEERLLAVQHRR